MFSKSIKNSSSIFLSRRKFGLEGNITAFKKKICTFSGFQPVKICVKRKSTTALGRRPGVLQFWTGAPSGFLLQGCSFHCKLSANFYQRKNQSTENIEFQQRLSLVKRSVERMATTGMTNATHATSGQSFDYFLVLDFEATCDDERPPKPQEIIEFPVLKVNARTHAVDSIFHHYVRPVYNPLLSPFCTELTGIVQEMVDNQLSFPEVFKSFEQWMQSEGLLHSEVKSIFVTCGDWDLRSMLPRQCETSRLASKSYFHKWINIKKSYADVTRTFPKGMMHMLTGLNLQHIGRHHSGIDDCRNIANIVVELMKRGYVFRENGWLK